MIVLNFGGLLLTAIFLWISLSFWKVSESLPIGDRIYRISLWISGTIFGIILITDIWFTFKRIGSILTPFLIAFVLAYVFDPVVTWIQGKARISRTLAISILYILFSFIFLLLFLLFVPKFLEQVYSFVASVPDLIGKVQEELFKIGRKIGEGEVPEYARKIVEELMKRGQSIAIGIAGGLANFILSIFSNFLGLLIVPVVSFYLMKDMSRISRAFIKAFPDRYEGKVEEILGELDGIFSGYFRGQLTDCLIFGLVIWAGLFILGVDYSILLGIWAGIANLIPYVGALIGAVPAVLVALMELSIFKIVGVIALFSILSVIDGSMIAPRIIGGKVGLHPVISMLAVLIGGQFLGFLGVFLGVPVAAIIKTFGLRAIGKYKAIDTYLSQDKDKGG